MIEPDRCPACRADLSGGVQPAALRHLARQSGPRSRARGVPDGSGSLVWECPECGHHWDREATPPGPRGGRPGETSH